MITIRCLVDNTALRSSAFWGEHGVAYHIESSEGQVLFDTGQSGEVLLHNAKVMGLDLKKIDALAISHAHYDHTGGLVRFLAHCRKMLPLYANPDLFQDRYSLQDGEAVSIGLSISKDDLGQRADLNLSTGPTEILPGIWTTGEITDRSDFEGRSPHHRILVEGQWQPDPYRDDLSLVIETELGLIILCGCCHAGLLNTLNHVDRVFHRNISAIVGGTHLVSITDEMLNHAIEVLRSIINGDSPNYYLSHCTGERAYLALAKVFGERVRTFPAGSVLNFEE